MGDAFVAEKARLSEAKEDSLNLRVTLVDEAGAACLLSLSPTAVTELAQILKGHIAGQRHGELTRMPSEFSIGYGRYERLVLLRFEDDVAYGLAPELASELAEALSEEVADLSLRSFPLRQ